MRYISLLSREPHRIRAVLLMTLAPLLTGALLVYLVWPTHWVEREAGETWMVDLDIVMLVAIGLIELFMVVNVVSIAHATMVARDPVPVVPESGTRVAFLTTYVPGKEPLAMVRATLEGATRVHHTGPLDVWLLDEGDDERARALCAELGVRHFSRHRVPEWNRDKGVHKARTKHGNYNAWIAMHGDEYDFYASVDTDHVPLPNFLERMTGFFRDPDVAFVVGPQVYGNYTNPVTKAAESQQFLFHALIQRAGNRYRAPMFVGTNNVVRIAARQTDRRAVRLHHRGHGHRVRTAPPPQSAHRAPLAVRLHARRAGRRRGARVLDRLLHPADALVARHVRDALQAVLEGALHHAPGPALLVHADARLLPDDRRQLVPRRSELLPLPLVRGLRHPGRRLRLADALQRRRRPPDRALPVEPAAQRLARTSPRAPAGSPAWRCRRSPRRST